VKHKHAKVLAAVRDCLPRDEEGKFVAERERSDVVHDLRAFLAVLKKNRKKLAVDPAGREPGETLRAEFELEDRKIWPILGLCSDVI
jgi:hypothetical protein